MHVRRTTEMAGWAVLRVILVDRELAGRLPVRLSRVFTPQHRNYDAHHTGKK
jgi:hypothetical protein